MPSVYARFILSINPFRFGFLLFQQGNDIIYIFHATLASKIPDNAICSIASHLEK